MSYTEKPDEITKDEWMEKLNNLHVQRADMNRLIMNYLVTGEGCAVLPLGHHSPFLGSQAGLYHWRVLKVRLHSGIMEMQCSCNKLVTTILKRCPLLEVKS